MGVGIQIAAEILRDPHVFDLLISMLYSAVNGGRIELNFPDQVMLDSPNYLFIKPDGTQDVEQLRQVLELLPSVREMEVMARSTKPTLKEQLDTQDRRLYVLLRWLVSSNRSHLRLLTPQG